MKERTRILILRTIKFSESDLVVHGLDQSGGRLNLLAKGALKSRKRFGGGVLQATHYVEVCYRRRKVSSSEGPLHFLEEAELLKDFRGLRLNYQRLELAFYFLTLASQLSQEGDISSPELFDLLGNALKACERTESLEILRTHFELKVLGQQGVMPEGLPDLSAFQRPLSEHNEIVTEQRPWSEIKNGVHFALRQYLSR